MHRSLRPLQMLVLITIIVMLIFATLAYYAERGTYDETLGLWMRVAYYRCPYTCTSTTTAGCPLGREGRPSLDRGEGLFTFKIPRLPVDPKAVQPEDAALASSLPGCEVVYQQSPFDSIPAACWWALATITTTGYGEIVPITVLGKCIGVLCQMMGILVIALPTSVIGSNFTHIYEKMKSEAGGYYSDDDQEVDNLYRYTPPPHGHVDFLGSCLW